MTPDDFSFLAQLVRRRAGLVLTEQKMRLIEGRLSTVMRRFGFRRTDALISELRHGRDALARAVTEALTTNESSFFRDEAMFEALRKSVLPSLIEARAETKRLRIWSAACAAGQEAYSIAMLLDELGLGAAGWSIDLIATDISAEMIARAEEGVYSHFEVQRGLAIRHLGAHFSLEGANWRIAERLRRMVTFRQFNLLDSYGWLDDLDVVFCRNVLMYLDHRTKAQVIDKIGEVLLPDGVLVLGHSETASGLSNAVAPIGGVAGLYAKGKTVALRMAG